MPYTCRACCTYSPGQSADGYCPLCRSTAPAAELPAVTRIVLNGDKPDELKQRLAELVETVRQVEREAIAAWLRAQRPVGRALGSAESIAASIEAGEHLPPEDPTTGAFYRTHPGPQRGDR